ncbi:unnamed protein product [Adineta steineri]|uniref:Anti-proliferative protein domain-containing protein n=1 Tax=Adineta steineri TaxID=433720 RepID=A0A815F2N6_9BILA|nr:unnamed protein product [Adineta steineri]
MKQEISVALELLSSYVERFGSIKQESIEQFRTQLEKVLLERYQGHWYPDKPIKGQAYRSLEFNDENDFCDVIVAQVCRKLGFTPNLLGIRHQLTLWIDPYEVSVRLGNHVHPKDNQQLIVARFDKEGNELIHNDLDTLFSECRVPMVNTSRVSPVNSSPCDSASCSGASTPQRTSSPFPVMQPSMYYNAPLFTPPRALSPQAPIFQMSSSSPINVPLKPHPLETSINNLDENSPIEGNNSQPDRSDTPHSMLSTTSNESSDSGYCGYVESYPYYYKLNRLYKALALQKHSSSPNPTGKSSHHRRMPNQMYQQRQNYIPSFAPSSPPTPTPMNIDRVAPYFTQQTFLQIPTTATGSRKSKY